MKTSYGAQASWTNITASFAAFGIGMIIMGRGGDGADAAVAGTPLLALSEILKIVIGISLVAQSTALATVTGSLSARIAGILAGVAMLVAGSLGLAALWLPAGGSLGISVNPIALGGVVATGLWAALNAFSAFRTKSLPMWLCIIGFLFAIPCLATPFMPPAALAAFALGILWNVGVGMRLVRPA